MRGRRVAAAGLAVVMAVAGALGAKADDDLAAVLKGLGGETCADSELTCVALEVPADHGAVKDGPSTTVHFAVSLATGERKGVLFYAVGGPGYSGLKAAQGYLDDFDQRLREQFDVVFFDQRGVGESGGLTCVKAQTALDLAPFRADDYAAAKEAARTFVADCLKELPAGTDLAHYDTEAVVRDLEAFRQALGVSKIWLYGESYGTQVAQQYATAFPEAVAGVVIDGDVDLHLTLEGFYASYSTASEAILARVFAACGEIAGCRGDLADPAAVYDDLLGRLREGPLPVQLTLVDGKPVLRQLTPGLLDAAAFFALYTPGDRADFLRALAAAGQGRLGPMLRLAYADLGVDPDSGLETADPSFFGAAYYAVMCADYGPEPGWTATTPEARADAVIAEAKAFAPKLPRLLRDYYVERLVCAYWPQQGPVARPAPFAGGDYPTLILTADADPITPKSQAYAILDGAANSSLISMRGGPHVTFGRGLPCPDEIVFATLVEGKRPEAREQVCEQALVEGYTPLTLTGPGDSADPFLVARAIETELAASPEISGWDGSAPLAVGCEGGGRIAIEVSGDVDIYRFEGCTMWPGMTIEGAGRATWADGQRTAFALDFMVSGRHTGMLSYRHNLVAGARSLAGTYDGASAGTPR